jgi:SAM-dependent methyltransferase
MAKAGEIRYLSSLDAAGQAHARNKPFSDADCGIYLMRIGAIMALLPPPPASILDLGCGTGWTSAFFAQRGYPVTGVDIAADMIAQARDRWDNVPGLTFAVSDYEALAFAAEFDGVVFFDALHHAVDERAALAFAWHALKPGGICVTSEPGVGHANSAD